MSDVVEVSESFAELSFNKCRFGVETRCWAVARESKDVGRYVFKNRKYPAHWSRYWSFIKSSNSSSWARQRWDFMVVDIVGERARQRERVGDSIKQGLGFRRS